MSSFYFQTKETGFVVIRVLVKDMNATSIMTMVPVLRESKIDLGRSKQLEQSMK
jgi:hypothetical protein